MAKTSGARGEMPVQPGCMPPSEHHGRPDEVGRFLGFLVPDFGQCGAGLEAVAPAWGYAIEALTKVVDWENTGSEPWRHSWLAFVEDPILCCVYGCCLPCQLALGARTVAATTGLTCEAAFWAMCCTCCMSPCYHAAVRTNMRTKYNLAGSRGEDCLLTWCCGPCALCQEARELGAHEPFVVPFTTVMGTGGQVAPPAVAKAPAAVQPMVRTGGADAHDIKVEVPAANKA